jgi:hypothetical protein
MFGTALEGRGAASMETAQPRIAVANHSSYTLKAAIMSSQASAGGECGLSDGAVDIKKTDSEENIELY